jgi:hypothetical protein
MLPLLLAAAAARLVLVMMAMVVTTGATDGTALQALRFFFSGLHVYCLCLLGY